MTVHTPPQPNTNPPWSSHHQEKAQTRHSSLRREQSCLPLWSSLPFVLAALCLPLSTRSVVLTHTHASRTKSLGLYTHEQHGRGSLVGI